MNNICAIGVRTLYTYVYIHIYIYWFTRIIYFYRVYWFFIWERFRRYEFIVEYISKTLGRVVTPPFLRFSPKSGARDFTPSFLPKTNERPAKPLRNLRVARQSASVFVRDEYIVELNFSATSPKRRAVCGTWSTRAFSLPKRF